MKLHSILGLLLALAAALIAFSAHAACDLQKLPDLPVTMEGPRAIVPARVNGVDGRFMVDTGAFFSSVSPAAVAKFGLKVGQSAFGMTVSGAGHGNAQFAIGTSKSFVIDGLPFNDSDFVVFEAGRASAEDGSIGQNVLGAPDVEYDLANGAIRLFKPVGCQNADLAYWVTTQTDAVLPIQAEGFLSPPIVTATLNGVRIRVMLDTGTPESILSLATAARAGVKPDDPAVISAGYSAGVALRSQFKIWTGRFASFKIGGEEIKNTPLHFGDLDMANVDMLLGADFFLSHRVYISNNQHRVYFTYNGGPVFDPGVAPARTVVGAVVASPQAAGAAPTDADAPQDAPGYARRAAASMSRRQYADAIADLTKAMVLAPTDPDYVYKRGVAELGNHQPFLGMADLETALKLKPDDVRVLVTRAEIYWSAHQPDQAAADLAAADRAAEKDPDKRLVIGSAYMSMRRYKEAIPELDQWVVAHPVSEERSAAFNNRCWARAQLGVELDKALADCDASLKLNPGDPVALDSRGLVLLRTGAFDKSIADYDAALRLRPNTAWSLYGRGLAELRKGMAAEGHADLAAATALNPKLPDEAKAVGLAP